MTRDKGISRSSNRVRIWVTRELSEGEIELARSLDLEPVVSPAIRTRMTPERAERTLPEPAIWIFTSRNGVRGYAETLRMGGSWPTPRAVFAVGEQTAIELKRQGMDADWPEEENATGLAHLILRWVDLTLTNEEKSGIRMIHWCGNRSRPELGEVLSGAGYSLVSQTVYRTDEVEVASPSEPVQAILFYSPSAVASVRSSGAWPEPMPALYAIGETTARALSMESDQPVHLPQRASTESLLRCVARDLIPKRPVERDDSGHDER